MTTIFVTRGATEKFRALHRDELGFEQARLRLAKLLASAYENAIVPENGDGHRFLRFEDPALPMALSAHLIPDGVVLSAVSVRPV